MCTSLPTSIATQSTPLFLGFLDFQNGGIATNTCKTFTNDQANPKICTCGSANFFRPKWLRMLHASVGNEENTESLKKICNIFISYSKIDIEPFLQKSRLELSPSLVEQVLKKFENAGMQAFTFFKWADKQQRYTHRVEAYHIIIGSLGRIRKFELIWVLINDMKGKGILTQEAFSLVIKWYARARMDKEAIETFKNMGKFGLSPDLATFNNLLIALCKCKYVRRAQEIFDEMKAEYVPDLRTYSIMLEGWGDEHKVNKAREIFQEMIDMDCEPDIVVYVILMNAFCKVGEIEEAVKVLDEMRSRGCKPNLHAYSVLVHAYGSNKQIAEALDIFEKMKKDTCAPDTPTYNALIGAFCSASEIDGAYRTLEEMERSGVSPNSRTYNIILAYLIKHDRTEEAHDVFRRMVRRNCDPDAKTYTMMIKMFCNGDQVDMALKVWNQMSQKQFCPTSENLYVLINGLCDQGKIKKACKFFEEMIEKGIQPPATTYNRLKNGLLDAGNEDVLKYLSEKMTLLTKAPSDYS